MATVNVRVVCRFRPLNQIEKDSKQGTCVDFDERNVNFLVIRLKIIFKLLSEFIIGKSWRR